MNIGCVSNLRLYRKVFDALEAQVTEDVNPILDRYLEHYLDLTRTAGER